MGHLKNDSEIEISPYFSGSICNLFLVKARKSLIVKSLKSEYRKMPILMQRFINEIEIIRSIQNDCTPSLIKSRLDCKRPYFAYEHIDGVSLEKEIHGHALPLAQCIDIIGQLLTLLSALHQGGNAIIHSDISPDNIILSAQGKVYLIDFGCACKLNDQKDSANTWIGKHAYLSPEQAQGHQWSIQSDLYQVGLVFYEMLTGVRRNSGQTLRDMLPLAANPPALELEGIDQQYHDFIGKILSVECERRFQTAQQALLELNNI
jgi:serine/threonine-protein kinase